MRNLPYLIKKTNNSNHFLARQSVSYFSFDGIITIDEPFVIRGEEVHHIAGSRRIRRGERIEVQDRTPRRYIAEVADIKKRELVLKPLKQTSMPEESPCRIHLFQALVKEKALDTILQKTTELGVTSIGFFHSEFSQRISRDADVGKKLDRWRKIAVEACKQSGRAVAPEISFYPQLSEDNLSPAGSSKKMLTLCLSTSQEKHPLSKVLTDNAEINLLVGPEGGWKQGELNHLTCREVCFGPRILRSDTAAVMAVSILQYLRGDLKQLSG